MIESKLIQVNKKKIAYIFVVLENVVYLRCDQARPQVDMMALYSPTVGGILYLYLLIAHVVGY